MQSAVDCDVLIVGFGPTGATAANLLGAFGVKTIVLERDSSVFPRQRAINIDEDALRIWQSVGLLEEITAHMDKQVFVHMETQGRRIMTFNGSDFGVQGVPGSCLFHQPFMEAVLRKGAARFAECVDIRQRHEFTGLAQDDAGVTVSVALLDEDGAQTGETTTLRARFVIAADGGSSPTRKAAGIALPGSSITEPWIDIQAVATDPRRLGGPTDFTFFCTPDRPGVDCAGGDGYHRWEFRLEADEDPEEMVKPENVRKLLALRNVDYDDLVILKTWVYTFHIRQAESWRKGRVLLAGDAAHIMPPFAGQGISSGVRDAGNLCWKLAAVIKGGADASLLDSYESERQKNVEDMTKVSLDQGKGVMEQSRFGMFMRDTMLRLLSRLPYFKDAIYEYRSKPRYQIGAGLLSRAPTKKGPVGHYIPQPWVVDQTKYRERLDYVLGEGWSWLSMHESTIPPALRERGVREVIFRPFDQQWIDLADNEIVDPSRSLTDFFRKHRAKGMLIRPDRFIYGTDRDPIDAASLPALDLRHSSDVTPTVNTKSYCSLIDQDPDVSTQLGQNRIRHLSKDRVLEEV